MSHVKVPAAYEMPLPLEYDKVSQIVVVVIVLLEMVWPAVAE